MSNIDWDADPEDESLIRVGNIGDRYRVEVREETDQYVMSIYDTLFGEVLVEEQEFEFEEFTKEEEDMLDSLALALVEAYEDVSEFDPASDSYYDPWMSEEDDE